MQHNTMNKFAHSYMSGQDLIVRMYTGEEADAVNKVASEGGELDEQYVENIQDFVDEQEFHDNQVKIAHNVGTIVAFTKVAEYLQSDDFDAEKFLEELDFAIKTAQETLPIPANEDEDLEDDPADGQRCRCQGC